MLMIYKHGCVLIKSFYTSRTIRNLFRMSAPDDGFYLAGGLAAADFPDAEDARPIGAYMEALGGNHNAIPVRN